MKRLLWFLAIAGGIGLATVTNAAQTPEQSYSRLCAARLGMPGTG